MFKDPFTISASVCANSFCTDWSLREMSQKSYGETQKSATVIEKKPKIVPIYMKRGGDVDTHPQGAD